MSRVLVTGASGFIGRQSLRPLVALGHEVHAVSRGRVVDEPGVTWHVADLLEAGAAEAVVGAVVPDRLLHLAWDARPGIFWTSPQNLDWVAASLRLLRAFAERGGARAVLAGSCAEYAWSPRTHCVEATTPLVPVTLYGAAKHALRIVAEPYAEQAGVELAWGRIFFVFGPHEDEARLAASVASALVRGEPAETSHGCQLRDFLYSEDLAAAFVALLGSRAMGAVNVASGEPVSIRAFVEALADAAARPELLRIGARESPPGEPDALTADVGRLRDEVGWAPSRSLTERAADTVEWWRRRDAARA